MELTSPCSLLTPSSISVADLDISEELLSRRAPAPNRKAESDAMYGLAGTLRQGSRSVLKHLAKLATELCEADSAGVSVIETSESGTLFRWQALAGRIERYEGGSTPRDWSPCAECLKAERAVLYSYPERYFTYLQALGFPIVEGLIIPVLSGGIPLATIWIATHTPERRFNAEHVRIMTSLGDFTSSTLEIAQCALSDSITPNHQRPSKSTEQAGATQEIVWREYLKRIALHDENALEALFRETRSLVFAAALRIVSYRCDAEEVADDVFARAWTTAGAYDARRGTVCGWLVGMARSCAIDRLRSRAVRQRTEEALFSNCISRNDPDALIDASQRRAYLNRALKALPVEQRQAIELFYFSELPTPSIAAQLGQPIGTVKTRLRLGMIKLRRLLASLETVPCRRESIHNTEHLANSMQSEPRKGSA